MPSELISSPFRPSAAMRVVLFALLAVGVLNALPLEFTTEVEASGAEGSGEGSGVFVLPAPDAGLKEEEEISVALRSERSHSNERSSEENYHQSRPIIIKAKKNDDSKHSSEETTTVRVVRHASKSHEDASDEEYHRMKRDAETVEAASVVAQETIEKVEKNNEALVSALRELADNTTTEAASVEEEGSGVETTTAGSKCKLLDDCQDDSDCHGGRCMGAFLGTCNCGSCMSFLRCSTDAECGGFNQACNTTTGVCDCYGAYVLNGYKDTFDALGRLCNVKQCGRDTAADDCHGLGCNRGRCFC